MEGTSDIDVLRARAEALSPEEQIRAAHALLERPPLFDLEAASACNLRCRFCPREHRRLWPPLMSLTTFAAVRAFMPEGAVVMFSGLGEPLLNPRLETYVAALKEDGVSSCAITNGLLLDEDRQMALMDAGIDQFQISLHSLDPPAWVEITGGRAEEHRRVLGHLDRLAEQRRPGLRVQVNAVLVGQVEEDVGELERYASERRFDLYLRRVHSRGGTAAGSSLPAGTLPCGILASVTFIACDGVIHVCSNDVEGIAVAGSVDGLSWEELVDWKRGRLASAGGAAPCSSCSDDYRWAILAHGSVDVPRGA